MRHETVIFHMISHLVKVIDRNITMSLLPKCLRNPRIHIAWGKVSCFLVLDFLEEKYPSGHFLSFLILWSLPLAHIKKLAYKSPFISLSIIINLEGAEFYRKKIRMSSYTRISSENANFRALNLVTRFDISIIYSLVFALSLYCKETSLLRSIHVSTFSDPTYLSAIFLGNFLAFSSLGIIAPRID